MDLGPPERVLQLLGPGVAEDFPPLRSLANRRLQHNLPEQVSSFVGRDRGLEEIRSLLAGARLVTLAGPGGVGKTRLALQAGADYLERSGDEVWFVDLAPISDPSLVATAVGKILQVREQPGRPLAETLADVLQDRQMLLLVDNCEHVIEAAATLVDSLLRGCRQVRFLATSREPLGVEGEHLYRVPSLSVPPPDEHDLGVLIESEAVRLFVDRARQQKAHFTLDATNGATVGRLCRRLDGIPFAIELAAARVRSLSVRDLEATLDQQFRLLTSRRTAVPRQHTLQALIDWSYDLLSPSEQAALRRMSVFAGGFDMAAAVAVCPGADVEPFEVLGLLDALVDKSLVLAEDREGAVRYRLLETIREYAVARLAEQGPDEGNRVRRAHRDHFLVLAQTAEGHLRGPGELEWVNRLDTEFDNLRTALAECLADPDPWPGLRLGEALSEFWVIRGYGIEGAETLLRHLARAEAQEPTVTRGLALVAAADLVKDYLTDYPAAINAVEEALRIARASGDDSLEVKSLILLARIRSRQGDYAESLRLVDDALPIARRLDDVRFAARLLNVQGCALDGLGRDGRKPLEESAALYRRAGDRRGVALAVNNLGLTAFNAGDLEAARQLFGEAVEVMRQLGDQQGVAMGALNSGYVATLDGDADSARRLFQECLDITRRIVARPLLGYAILGMALTASLTRDDERAAALHGAFAAFFEQLGAVVEALEANLRDADQARLRKRLGDARFSRAYQLGLGMTLDEALTVVSQTAPQERSVISAVGHETPSPEELAGETRRPPAGTVPPSEAATHSDQATLSFDGTTWRIRRGETTFLLRPTKGVAYLAELIAHPGVERHVMDLLARTDPVDAEGTAIRTAIGDAGPLIDDRAKAEYRRRIGELREQLDDALAVGNDDKAAVLQSGIDAIVHELAAAIGLGGKDRRASSAAEKARLNVTRAIRGAIARIEQVDVPAGRALDRGVRTGFFCVYEPGPGDLVWTIGG